MLTLIKILKVRRYGKTLAMTVPSDVVKKFGLRKGSKVFLRLKEESAELIIDFPKSFLKKPIGASDKNYINFGEVVLRRYGTSLATPLPSKVIQKLALKKDMKVEIYYDDEFERLIIKPFKQLNFSTTKK